MRCASRFGAHRHLTPLPLFNPELLARESDERYAQHEAVRRSSRIGSERGSMSSVDCQNDPQFRVPTLHGISTYRAIAQDGLNAESEFLVGAVVAVQPATQASPHSPSGTY